ncbi:hypothetical protein J2X06_000860 [Lysobacter niastensis]|uniref:DUF4124 domain-containing protein n=1 Tax=Lysobacter niastensis TaxID=380629 RepID=A0ABU1W7V1_9GAMM|nr:hypothetical protein [Lysobacter niastensis]MDR7133676.1 hypothetical protein [Lysobacter niastensis]
MLLLLLVAALASSPAIAQVRRCVSPGGAVVFTDHECAEIGAQEQAARPASPAASSRTAYRGCARTVHDLMYEMTSAFDAHDANRLAGVYHWAGMSGSSAYSILDRLDAMVQRPLVDLVPVMPDSPTSEGAADVGEAATRVDGEYYPQTSVRSTPVALRVEQTQANGITPSRTVFGLRKHLGCWWVQL